MKDFLSVIEGFDRAPSGIPYGVNLFFTILDYVLLCRDFNVTIDKRARLAEFFAPSIQSNYSQLFLDMKRSEVIISVRASSYDEDGNPISFPVRSQFFTAFEALGGKGGLPDYDTTDDLVHISLVEFMPPPKKENLEEIAKAMEILVSAIIAAYNSVASS